MGATECLGDLRAVGDVVLGGPEDGDVERESIGPLHSRAVKRRGDRVGVSDEAGVAGVGVPLRTCALELVDRLAEELVARRAGCRRRSRIVRHGVGLEDHRGAGILERGRQALEPPTVLGAVGRATPP
jgi:hypothetical protein